MDLGRGQRIDILKLGFVLLSQDCFGYLGFFVVIYKLYKVKG